MAAPPAETADLSLRAAAALAGLDEHQLWGDCLLLVGEDTISRAQVIEAVSGARTPRSVFNLVATAVNERLSVLGLAPLVTLKPFA
jgi:hypothetical protein